VLMDLRKPMNVFNSHRPTRAGDRDERHDRATAIRTQPIYEKRSSYEGSPSRRQGFRKLWA
jgi:hypothetical protein